MLQHIFLLQENEGGSGGALKFGCGRRGAQLSRCDAADGVSFPAKCSISRSFPVQIIASPRTPLTTRRGLLDGCHGKFFGATFRVRETTAPTPSQLGAFRKRSTRARRMRFLRTDFSTQATPRFTCVVAFIDVGGGFEPRAVFRLLPCERTGSLLRWTIAGRTKSLRAIPRRIAFLETRSAFRAA